MFDEKPNAPLAPGIEPVPEASQPIISEIQSSKKKKKKLFLVIIVLFVIFAVLGGGGAFAYMYWQKLNDPQIIWQDAMSNMEKATTISQNISMNFVYKPNKDYKPTISPDDLFGTSSYFTTEFKVNVIANVNSSQEGEYLATAGDVTISFPTGIEVPLLGQLSISPKINFITKQKDIVFLKIEGIPPIPFLSLDPILNKWIKIDANGLKEKYGVDFQKFETDKDGQGEMNEVIRFYKQNNFLILQRVGLEDKNGEKTHHIKIGIEKKKFALFIKSLIEYAGQKYPQSVSDTKEFDVSLNEALGLMAISGDAWITKEPRNFKDVSFTIALDVPEDEVNKGTVTPGASKQKVGTLTLNISAAYSNFNKPIAISEPADFVLIDDVIGEMSALYQPQPTAPVEGMEKDSDNDGLSDFSEQMYDADPNNPDSDGDGFKDGDEVKNGFNPAGPGKLIK